MGNGIVLEGELSRYEELLHELVFRDKLKSSEFHFAVSFDFDGFFEPNLIIELFSKMSLLSKEFEFSSFKLGVSWPVNSDDAVKLHQKHALQTPLIEKISSELGKEFRVDSPDLEFLVDFNKNLVLVRVKPVYVCGRYCKFVRTIAQTEYFCNKCRGKGCWYCRETGHFSEESVEQLLEQVLVPKFGAKLLIMHGAGREDMDVLMLGSGRPFIAELLLPKKRFADLKLIGDEINEKFSKKISVNSLSLVTRRDVSPLKDTPHDKLYAALVHSDKSVDYSKLKIGEKFSVLQHTPTRVAERRADLIRSKEVVVLRVGEINSQEFVIILRTSHGTYVKEFISGDNGRTSPSVSELIGAHCECVLLDVIEVCA